MPPSFLIAGRRHSRLLAEAPKEGGLPLYLLYLLIRGLGDDRPNADGSLLHGPEAEVVAVDPPGAYRLFDTSSFSCASRIVCRSFARCDAARLFLTRLPFVLSVLC